MDPISNSEVAPAKKTLTDAEIRTAAIKAYHDATTREAKALVVKQYPVLEGIYSAGNHN